MSEEFISGETMTLKAVCKMNGKLKLFDEENKFLTPELILPNSATCWLGISILLTLYDKLFRLNAHPFT